MVNPSPEAWPWDTHTSTLSKKIAGTYKILNASAARFCDARCLVRDRSAGMLCLIEGFGKARMEPSQDINNNKPVPIVNPAKVYPGSMRYAPYVKANISRYAIVKITAGYAYRSEAQKADVIIHVPEYSSAITIMVKKVE